MPEYDFKKYRNLIKDYIRYLGRNPDAGNFQCLSPDHNDGSNPSDWSMGMGIGGETVHCYGCGLNGHDWDIYDLMGAQEGTTEKCEQFRRVAAWAGDIVERGGQIVPRMSAETTIAEPTFTPDPAAIDNIYQYMKTIRPAHLEDIASFCRFRGFDAPDYGKRFAWWPGNAEAIRGGVPARILVAAGLIDPSKPADKAAWNASGVVVKIGRGFKLHYAGRTESDGYTPTVKRGSRGCHTFPFPALPDPAESDGVVVLCEGELDAVSGRFAGLPVVSIGGTNGLSKDDADTLTASGYSRIILALDNDDAGRKAIEAIARKIGLGVEKHVYIADWSTTAPNEKDIDDLVKHGKTSILLDAIENAKEWREEDGREVREVRGKRDGNTRDSGERDQGADDRGIHEAFAGNGRGVQGENADNAEGAPDGTQGAQIDREEYDARSTGAANHGNDQQHESADRSVEIGGPHDEDGVITPAGIPFQFLGFDEGAYYFLPKRQNVAKRVGCTDTSIKQMMYDLAPESWWLTYFHKESREGIEYVDTSAALEWIRTSSTRKGMFNHEKLLGTGAYKDGDHAVVNTGYAIVTPDGSVSRFEDYTGKLAFVRSPVELAIDAEPWTVGDGRFFFSQLKTFGFDQPLAYYSIAGWCAIAPFSAFLFRRPHIWITAKRGMGKTFLIDQVISPLLGEDYVFYTDGSTEAGIRQSLYRDNRPVIMDEFEANNKYDADTLEKILELSRSAYGGKRKVKGSSSQKAISFTLRVMFCFASINVNISNDADRSRIAVCRMTESNGRMKSIPNPDGLRSRIFHRLDEITPNTLAIHALMEEAGYEYRTADTYSPLLAGLWMILSDRAFPKPDEMDGLSDSDRRLYDHILASLPQTAQTEEKRPDEERILEEIFQTRLRLESGNEKTVSEMLTTLDDMQKPMYDDAIQRFGIKKGKDRDGIEFLAIVHDSKEIKAMLKDTPFGNSYKEVLKRNPAYMDTRQIHVARQQMSCIVLRWQDVYEKYFKEVVEADVVPF